MELVELLNHTRMIRDDELTRWLNSFISNKALLLGFPKGRVIMATPFVSMGCRGF
jgi:hypothetical protein